MTYQEYKVNNLKNTTNEKDIFCPIHATSNITHINTLSLHSASTISTLPGRKWPNHAEVTKLSLNEYPLPAPFACLSHLFTHKNPPSVAKSSSFAIHSDLCFPHLVAKVDETLAKELGRPTEKTYLFFGCLAITLWRTRVFELPLGERDENALTLVNFSLFFLLKS